MQHLGGAKIDSAAIMMPPKPISNFKASKIELKPTLKKFQAEIQETMKKSQITPQMRRLQALGSLEVLLARKSMNDASKSGGLTENGSYDPIVGMDAFFKSILEKEKSLKTMGFPTPLEEADGLISFGAYGETGGGHAMVIQMDDKKGLYRFADPNYGMWTFPDKQALVEKVTSFMDSHYPKYENFYGTVYHSKK